MAKVRLFAVLKELAGASEVEAEGETVEQVIQVLCDRYGAKFTSIVERSQVVVDKETVALDYPLVGGEEVALLPPVSGGAPV